MRIGFVSGRFMLGMGIDPILNFLPFLSKYCEIICFNVGYKKGIEHSYRTYNIDIVHLPISIIESALFIQKYCCDVVIDLDGFHSLEHSMPEVFFYPLAPLMIRYYGTKSSTNFNLHVLSTVYRNYNSGLCANLFSLSAVINPLDSEEKLSVRQYPNSFCIGIAAHPWECNDYLIKKFSTILKNNKSYKIVFFYHKLGGYLSFLELTRLLKKDGLTKRVIVSPITTGVFFSYKLFLHEIDCLVDFSVTNSLDEAYYSLQNTIPVLSVRGHGIRTEVADFLENLKLNSYVFSSDDKLVEFLSSINNEKLSSLKEEIKKILSSYDTKQHAKNFFHLLSEFLNKKCQYSHNAKANY